MTATATEVLERADAEREFAALEQQLGGLEHARELARVGLLPESQDAPLRRAETLAWLLSDD